MWMIFVFVIVLVAFIELLGIGEHIVEKDGLIRGWRWDMACGIEEPNHRCVSSSLDMGRNHFQLSLWFWSIGFGFQIVKMSGE